MLQIFVSICFKNARIISVFVTLAIKCMSIEVAASPVMATGLVLVINQEASSVLQLRGTEEAFWLRGESL